MSGSETPTSATATPLDGRALNFARPVSGAEMNIGAGRVGYLGVGWWMSLTWRPVRRHRRLFGGYAFGVKTSLHQGGLGDRQVKIPCTGYGIVLDRTYITSRLATAADRYGAGGYGRDVRAGRGHR